MILDKRGQQGRLARSGWPEFERDPEERRKLLPGVVRKTQIVREMNERHHEVARMVLLGYRNTEIAKILNITKEFVCAVRNAPPVKEQVAILAGARDAGTVDIARQIQLTLPKCIKYLDETIEDDEISDNLKSRNAFGLMAIGGHSPAKNINVRGVHAILTADDIKEIRDNAENVALEIGILEKEA
ncbi:hypothetical protein KAX02_13810 [candidate division WOR-3 bacterium]|nr:hypothetical protein [candidate division WOR-3 bacterium]